MFKIDVINGTETLSCESEKLSIEDMVEDVVRKLNLDFNKAKTECYRMTISTKEHQLGTYYFESQEFYPSSYYDDNPESSTV